MNQKTTNTEDKSNFESWTESSKTTFKSRITVRRTELVLFTTQLSVMLDSGVVLSDALDAISGQAENGAFKTVIMELATKVKNGDSFSKSLTAYPKIFNSMFPDNG